ncbi:MAG: peptidase M41, partial [Flavobacteriaceae bacterium]
MGRRKNDSQFFSYLEAGDVEKVEIVNRREAKVYLTKEAQEKEIHKKSKPNSLFPTTAKIPNYSFEIGDLQNFENTFKETKKEDDLSTDLVFKTEQNLWGDFLIGILPFVLLIGVWIFIMRRMSGGGGAGGGAGQIFNIGKSKAKLFDQNTEVKTTFKDVAGLEGAKEE